MIDSTGLLPDVNYIYFLVTVAKLYDRGGWSLSEVDASILGAAQMLVKRDKLVDVSEYEATLYYPGYIAFIQYNKEEDYTMISYYPRKDRYEPNFDMFEQ